MGQASLGSSAADLLKPAQNIAAVLVAARMLHPAREFAVQDEGISVPTDNTPLLPRPETEATL